MAEETETSSPTKSDKSYYTKDNLDDIVDIILASDKLTKKLVRENTSKGENIRYYEEIRQELTKRCEAKDHTFTFTAPSIRTKFKKMVSHHAVFTIILLRAF